MQLAFCSYLFVLQASWTESRPKLEKDALGRATNPELDNVEREKLFRDHVKKLYDVSLASYKPFDHLTFSVYSYILILSQVFSLSFPSP